jgi:CRISPR-associated protein Cmr4
VATAFKTVVPPSWVKKASASVSVLTGSLTPSNESPVSNFHINMQTKVLYIFTRTPLHVGAGSSVGAIDQPIQRERHTGHPIIPGSSIKGVLRDAATQRSSNALEIDDTFGPEDSTSKKSDKVTRAGNVSFSEARVLAFPVRSAKGAFAYITCSFLLNHFRRLNSKTDLPEIPEINDQCCIASDGVTFMDKKSVVLEEYCFSHQGSIADAWAIALHGLVSDPVWQTVKQRLVILSDGDFAHFVKSTTEISNHNRIDAQTGTVDDGALFNLECVPAETLFMAAIHMIGRKEADIKRKDTPDAKVYSTDSEKLITDLITETPLLQFGGSSTTGRGFCSISIA